MNQAQPDTLKIGLIGLGNMGRGLAKNLLEAGYSLGVHDLNATALSEIKGLGGRATGNSIDLIKASEVILTCLPSIESIQQVYEAPEGIIENAHPGTVIIDFSTSSPDLTRKYGTLLEAKNIDLIDAPMLKNPQAAWDGTLHLLVSGKEDVIDHIRPILSAVSEDQVLVGELGNAHGMKIINNAVTIANGAILCEVFSMAKKLSIDPRLLHDVLNRSSASSKKLQVIAPGLMDDDHTSAYSVDLCLKDIELLLALSSEIGAHTPLARQTRDLFKLAADQGYGRENNTRVATVIEKFVADSPD